MSAEQKFRAGLALAALQPCLLCAREPVCPAAFIPNTASRVAFFSLCDACVARPDAAEAAQQILLGTAL